MQHAWISTPLANADVSPTAWINWQTNIAVWYIHSCTRREKHRVTTSETSHGVASVCIYLSLCLSNNTNMTSSCEAGKHKSSPASVLTKPCRPHICIDDACWPGESSMVWRIWLCDHRWSSEECSALMNKKDCIRPRKNWVAGYFPCCSCLVRDNGLNRTFSETINIDRLLWACTWWYIPCGPKRLGCVGMQFHYI